MGSGIPQRVREQCYSRDGAHCVRCARNVVNYPSSLHHRKPRGMGGSRDPRSFDPRNLVLVCGSGTTGCHGWIESHRDVARSEGWLLRSLDDLDQPLITLCGTEIRLYADGTSTETFDTELSRGVIAQVFGIPEDMLRSTNE